MIYDDIRRCNKCNGIPYLECFEKTLYDKNVTIGRIKCMKCGQYIQLFFRGNEDDIINKTIKKWNSVTETMERC